VYPPGHETIVHLCVVSRWYVFLRGIGLFDGPLNLRRRAARTAGGVMVRNPQQPARCCNGHPTSSLPRAASCMKPEMPKVSLLKERRAFTGKAARTPPRKDWRGVEPGRDMVRWVYAAGGQCHFRGTDMLRYGFSSVPESGGRHSVFYKSISGTHPVRYCTVLYPRLYP
jgi:hypothetical protein